MTPFFCHFVFFFTFCLVDYNFLHYYEYIGFTINDYSFDDNELNFYYDMPDWVDQCNTTAYCSIYPDSTVCSQSQGPSLPKLSDNFILTLEETSISENQTYLIKEYYDYPNDRAHIAVYFSDGYENSGMHQLELNSKQQNWFWIGDATDEDGGTLPYCTLSLTTPNYTGWEGWIPEVSGHVAKPSTWWRFNTTDATGFEKETWMGYTTVRGIRAEKWKSNWNYGVKYKNVSYVVNATLYYYFGVTGWDFTFSNYGNGLNGSNVPVRLEMDACYSATNFSSDTNDYSNFWKNGTFSNTYDVIGFVNNGATDDDFDIPINWRSQCVVSDDYCTTKDYAHSEDVCEEAPDMPTFPNQFESR